MRKMVTSLFYHPTNVLLLDDDRKFLNLLATKVDKIFPFVLEEDPSRALDYLKTHSYNLSQMAPQIARQNFDHLSIDKMSAGVESYDVCMSALRGDLSASGRFKKIVVVVVDRYMPAMDGLKFCQIVREQYRLPVKLILLTGATQVDEAIQAFNAGKIDAFVEKRTPKETLKQLNQQLHTLAQQQFSEISEYLMGFLSHQFSHIKDDNFCELFDKIRESEQITEYYLLDTSGSFLLINQAGQTKILLVKLDHDFEMMYDLAKDSGAMRNVLQALKDRQQYPYMASNTRSLSLKNDQWESVMVPMSKIPGREIFYSIIERPRFNVMGFDQYIGEIWPEH
ncbi:MAG: hypothetical protein A3F17_09255 [Gammaproteobacteria bacterium RIFCSPHIGHO2_12_FULL_41_15]|nr:MAG: hypothetical protein A3F17_09255 [Gammaproteobacteria bacterium RIFCSPHIGHO2_12_FULL_41_15]